MGEGDASGASLSENPARFWRHRATRPKRLSLGTPGGKVHAEVRILKSFVYLIVSLGFGALGLAGPPAQAQEDFLWPLPVEPRAITGTFMEFRQGRFHSGMDLRTQGREGLPVRAPAAGSITRLRTSPTGYGVAVYLQLDDGRMLVFGHLSVLSDRLREPILRAWEKTGRYQQYLYLKAGELRVERGELRA